MSLFEELMSSVTPEDGIREDFIEGALNAYATDMADLTTSHDTTIGEMQAAHDVAISELTSAHAAELESVRNEKFEDVLSGDVDVLPESYGDDSDGEVTFENYWEEA